MTIALIIAIVNAFAALVAYVTNHTIACGFNVAMAISIKKLEEENEILKRGY